MNKAIKAMQITYSYLRKYRNSKIIGPKIRKLWAQDIFNLLNVKIRILGAAQSDGSVIFVSNHISYFDIPLLVGILNDCVFVSKKEVSHWPIFGPASKKIGTVFVDRNSPDSRQQTREEIKRQLTLGKKKIVVFPAGTTSITGEKNWRKGVFEIAYNMKIPIQPVRINYAQLQKVAYIGNDFLPYHLFQLAKLETLNAEVEIHKPIYIQNILEDLEYCRNWCTAKVNEFTATTAATAAAKKKLSAVALQSS